MNIIIQTKKSKLFIRTHIFQLVGLLEYLVSNQLKIVVGDSTLLVKHLRDQNQVKLDIGPVAIDRWLGLLEILATKPIFSRIVCVILDLSPIIMWRRNLTGGSAAIDVAVVGGNMFA